MDVEMALSLMISFGMLVAFIMSEQKNNPSCKVREKSFFLKVPNPSPLDGVRSYCNRSMFTHGTVFI